MATSDEERDRILDALSPLPVTVKKMFGEYAVYLDGRIPGFITDGVLSLKVTEYSDPLLTPALLGEAYPGSKLYWRIPDALLADTEWLHDAIAATAGMVDPPAPRKRRDAGRGR